MIWLVTVAADPLDEFLEGAGSGTRLGEQLGTAGAAISVPALLVTVGVLAFMLYVHRGRRQEVVVLSRLLALCGLLIVIGGLLEMYGVRLVVGESWAQEPLGGVARGGIMRVFAGIACFAGFFRLGESSKRYRVGMFGVVLGVLSLSLTGHTVSEGNTVLLVSMGVVHVTVAGIWFGGLVGLGLTSLMRRSTESESTAPIVVRFSGLATLALIAVTAAGVGMSFLIVDTASDYVTTVWGRVLLIKVGLVVVAGAIGAYNHFVVVPALEDDPADDVYLRRSKVTVITEALILVGVSFMSVLLTEAPTN